MTPSSTGTEKPSNHPQKQKILIRKNCRKIKECSTNLVVGEPLAGEYLYESGHALKSICEACTRADEKENKAAVEAMLGSLPHFLNQLKGNIEDAITGIQGRSSAGREREERETALQALLALTTDWYHRLQQRMDETLQKRKSWEEKYPVQAAQEYELSQYVQSLQPLLDAPSARAISATHWQQVETSLASLQIYLLDNKISADQIKSHDEKGIEQVLRHILRQMEEWDAEGLGLQKDERVALETVEKIWGRVDKIGSGLNYLLILDERGDLVDGVKPTTRSVFLLKSAPPIPFTFSTSKDGWISKKLNQIRERLFQIVLNPDKEDIKPEDELRWNAAYRELEALEELVKREAKELSQKTITESGIKETIRLLCAKFESLQMPPKIEEQDSTFALLYISWELTLRIGAALGVASNAGSE